MTIELTNEEKAGIVQQHLKNLAYNKYNLQTTLTELNAVQNPSAADILEIESQIETVDTKISALSTELSSLQA